MYKNQAKQISFEDFDQPMGLSLNPNNRWVKKAQLINWDEIEKKYAVIFNGCNGQVAKPARMALGALIIQAEYGYSDEETVKQIQENPYLQYFCGMPGYTNEKPFDSSAMVRFRKRITADTLIDINNMFIEHADAQRVEKADKQDEKEQERLNGNTGTMIVDATCAPVRIKYPTDSGLLNTAREKLENIIDSLHQSAGGQKPRTYRKKAHKDFLNISKNKRPTKKAVRRAVKKQLQYVVRDLKYIQRYLEQGKKLSERQQRDYAVAIRIYEQQKQMFDTNTHSISDRIVSFHQPYIRPIVRGKTNKPVEFGPKIDISVVNGMVRLEKFSYDAYNESSLLKEEIENYYKQNGAYPARVLADKIYRTKENIKFCKELGIKLLGPALGRPAKNVERDRKAEYLGECERVEVERKFSLAKRKFGMSQIRTYLQETTQTVVALSILVMNLSKVLFCPFWECLKNCIDFVLRTLLKQKSQLEAGFFAGGNRLLII